MVCRSMGRPHHFTYEVFWHEKRETLEWLSHDLPPLWSHMTDRVSSASSRSLGQPWRGRGNSKRFYVSVKCQIPRIDEQNAQPRPAQPVFVRSGSNRRKKPSRPRRRVPPKWRRMLEVVRFCHGLWTARVLLKFCTLASLVKHPVSWLMPKWTSADCSHRQHLGLLETGKFHYFKCGRCQRAGMFGVWIQHVTELNCSPDTQVCNQNHIILWCNMILWWKLYHDIKIISPYCSFSLIKYIEGYSCCFWEWRLCSSVLLVWFRLNNKQVLAVDASPFAWRQFQTQGDVRLVEKTTERVYIKEKYRFFIGIIHYEEIDKFLTVPQSFSCPWSLIPAHSSQTLPLLALITTLRNHNTI